MKLADATPFEDLRIAFQLGVWPTLVSIWHSPLLLLQPWKISRVFMSHVWAVFGNGVDENSRAVKQTLITPYATGTILDLGAGSGHSANYLDRTKVTKYIALEPNVHMHEKLRATANKAGYFEDDGSFLILSCGAEDTSSILLSLGSPEIDTIISIMTLCSVPDPQKTITNLVLDVLKPGGQLLYYEHVLSPLKDVAWWQRFWTPIWTIPFDGCKLDRPTHLYVEEVQRPDGESPWAERHVWGKEGESEQNLFWHRVGRYVKA